MEKSKVAVLKTEPETVIEDYKRLMRLAEYQKFLKKGKTIILKDNISWHFPYPGANTTPWQLEGVIRCLREDGYDDIVCVQNKTVVTNAYKGERLNKYVNIFKKYDIPVLYNFKQEDMTWVKYEPKAKMQVLDKVFPKGIMVPDYFFDKNIIHLPTMKCHIYTTTTGAMKNAFGGLLNTRRHYTHSVIHKTLVDLLAIQKEIHSGIFAVTDGTVAGNGPGPRTMKPVIADYILASGDQVAIDAIASKIMGFNPMEIDYIRLGDEAGLGNGRPENIEVAGGDISGVNLGFEVGDNGASRVGDIMWFGPLKRLQWLFFHTPLVYIFVFGSAFYHDLYWYPLKGKKIVRDYQNNTKWGKLFMSYE
ncbi:MAG TPA: DUF362 domain-containing protein [Clostridiaceae bacterium]|nr:DUF362 domain-containing protein [Clostridiaceae bacterium]